MIKVNIIKIVISYIYIYILMSSFFAIISSTLFGGKFYFSNIFKYFSDYFFDYCLQFYVLILILVGSTVYIYLAKKIFKQRWFMVSVFLIPFLIFLPIFFLMFETWLMEYIEYIEYYNYSIF